MGNDLAAIVNRKYLPGLAALVCLALVVVLYYVTHKPFTPALALGLGVVSWRLLVAFLLVGLGGGIGGRIMPDLPLHPLARLAVQAALGLGVMSLIVLLAGALGWLSSWLGGVVLLVLLVVLYRSVWRWVREWHALLPAWREASGVGKFLGACLALIALFTLTLALAPPLRFDALVYHLALPLRYLSAGRLVYIPQNMFWGMPQNAEMMYTWAMMLGGAPAAVVTGWAFGLLALIGTLGYAANRLDVNGGWVSAAVLVSGYTLASALSWGYVDWLVMLFGLSFLVTFDLWLEHAGRRYLLLAGVFTGMAFGTKYTGGILCLGAVWVIAWREYKDVRALLRNLAQFALAALLFALPWLAKNWLATGNPVYPLFFPAGAMSAYRQYLYQGGEPWGGWLDVILLPLRATFLGIEGAPGYSSSIGPLFLGLGLCAGLGWASLPAARRQAIQLAAGLAVPAILAWMVLGRFSSYLLQTRLYFAIFPALGFLAGAGYTALKGIILPGLRLGRIAAFLVALAIGLNTLELGVEMLQRGALQAALGLQPAEEYLEENWGWFAPAMRAVRELPAGARVLMLWETRSLYCLPNCEPDEVLDRWLRELHDMPGEDARSPQSILENWRAQGYTHLLLHRLGVDFLRSETQTVYQPGDWQALESLLAMLPTGEDFGGAYTLYRLSP
jgi:hypothetical protein